MEKMLHIEVMPMTKDVEPRVKGLGCTWKSFLKKENLTRYPEDEQELGKDNFKIMMMMMT